MVKSPGGELTVFLVAFATGCYSIRTLRKESIVLVVTRKEGEEVIIGDPRNPIGIVRIVSVRGERVRIGFDFDPDTPVHRKEVADNIAGESGDEKQG